MILCFSLIFSGLTLLMAGAEGLVKYSAHIAKTFKISPLLIGLTIVAYGTSSPEFFVSAYASFTGKADLAISNVLGSNIFNLLFILGLTSLITPLSVHKQLIKYDVPIMIFCSLLLWFFALYNPSITKWQGIFFLMGLVLYTWWLIYMGQKEVLDSYIKEKILFSWKVFFLQITAIVLSLGLLGLGANLFIKGSIQLALFFNLSERVIGLTIVAAGTSLPEIATSLVAAFRKEGDIAVGNVIGSNIYNILAVLGLSSCLAPDELSISTQALGFDLPFMVATTIVCLPLLFSKYTLSRIEGSFLLIIYGTYISYLIFYP